MTTIPEEAPALTEDQASQLPACHLLQKSGGLLLRPRDAVSLRGGRKSRVILRPILERQLVAINAFDYGGRSHKFDRAAVEEAIRSLENLPDDGLVRSNERAWYMLRLGKGIPQTVDGDTK